MPRLKAVIFDLYGTLINIRTDEHDPALFAELSKFLAYNRVSIGPEDLHDFYHEEIKRQLQRSREENPEVDVYRVFTLVAVRYGSDNVDLSLPLYAARLFRSLSRKTFEPFPGVYSMLERLREKYPLALLSDAQRCFTEPEVETLKLSWFFDKIFLSSDYGYRKPDTRFFRLALDALRVKPHEAVYVGDNPARDLVGAKNAGMKMVLARSSEGEYNGHKADAVIGEIGQLEEALEGI